MTIETYKDYLQPPINIKNRSGLPVLWLVVLFLALAFCAQWNADYAASNTFIKSSVAGIGTASLLILWAWTCYLRNAKTTYLYITPGRLCFITLFLVGGLSIFWAVNTDFAITKWLLWLSAAISFFLVLNIELNERNLRLFAWGWVAGGTLVAIVGILQHLTDWLAFLPQAAPPSSTFSNKNMAAQIVVLVWPLSLFLLFSNRIQEKWVHLLGLCMALMLVYVFYTTTRAAWLSMLLQCMVIGGYLWFNRHNLKQWIHWNRIKSNSLIMAALLTLVMINFSAEGFTPFWQVATTELTSIAESADNSGSARYQIWDATLNMIKDYPWLGSGLGSFYHNISDGGYGTWYVRVFQRVHNDLLELMAELGVLGLALFVAVLVTLLQAVTQIMRGTAVKERWFYWLVLVSLSGSALNMMFSFPYQNAVPLFLFGCYAALLIKGSDPYNPSIKTLILKITPTQRLLIPVVTTLACSIVIVIYAEWIRAYEQIDQIDRRVVSNTFNSSHLAELDSTVYHLEVPTLLRGVSSDLMNRKKYRAVQIVSGEMLRYWPNNNVALEYYAASLIGLKHYNKALDILDRLRQVSPPGLYWSTIETIKIHEKMGHTEPARQLFKQLLQQPAQDLSRTAGTYMFLHKKSIDWKLFEHTPDLYQKFTEYHDYRCEVDSNMAAYYLLNKQPQDALQLGRKLLQNDRKCVSPWVLQKLQALDSSL